MTDARTLLNEAAWESLTMMALASDTPSGQALLAAAAEADTLRERVAALVGAARAVLASPMVPFEGDDTPPNVYVVDPAAMDALRDLIAPAPATDEARS